MTSTLSLLRDARATGETVAAIDHLLAIGYSLDRARRAVRTDTYDTAWLPSGARVRLLRARAEHLPGDTFSVLQDDEDREIDDGEIVLALERLLGRAVRVEFADAGDHPTEIESIYRVYFVELTPVDLNAIVTSVLGAPVALQWERDDEVRGAWDSWSPSGWVAAWTPNRCTAADFRSFGLLVSISRDEDGVDYLWIAP